MNLTIQTSTNTTIPLHPCVTSSSLPTKKIHDSNAWCAKGDFGSIFLEEFQSGPFTMRFTSFSMLKKITLYSSTRLPAICTRIATKNDWRFSLGAANEIQLREGQCALYRVGTGKEKISFEKGKEYQSFDAICPPGNLETLIELFPTLTEFLGMDDDTKPSILVQPPYGNPQQAISIVRDIADCSFQTSLRDYYIEHRIRELFFLLLAVGSKAAEGEETKPSPFETEAAHAAATIIRADIKQHHSIPSIAKRVKLNEFRLKYVFKHIFKTGMYEYLLQARMQEARRLLSETNKPINEIASLTGYKQITNFMITFRKYYGYTVGGARKR